jgi:hypothetical protein
MPVKVYNGTDWVTVAGDGQAGAPGTSSSIATWVKTASGGETSVSGAGDTGYGTLAYTVGQELVYLNGVLLDRGDDYTATNGTSITGLTALTANDVVTVWTVNSFSVANTYTQAQSDSRYPAKAGSVLQVVQSTTTTSTTISSTSLTDTTITATITPTSSTSKILVMVDAQAYITRASTTCFTGWALIRGATNIYDRQNEGFMAVTSSTATAVELVANSQITYLDSPATTSATTYKAQAKVVSGSITFQRNSVPSSITLIEIGA